MGRFINADDEDVLSDDQDNLIEDNLFACCLNNPVNMTDSDGDIAWWIAAAAGGAIFDTALYLIGSAVSGKKVTWSGVGKAALKGAISGVAFGAVGKGLKAARGVMKARKIAKAGKASKIGKVACKTKKTTKAAKVAKKIKTKKKACTSGSGRCFTAGTLVETKDGYVQIEKIQAGDYVYAEDPETGEKELKEVVQTFESQTNELVHIKVNGEKISATPGHPFYVPQKGWTSAVELRAGDKLILRSGEIVIVEYVQHEILESSVTVYNFEVEGFHTYYVTNSSVLVHNKGCGMDNRRILQNTSIKGYRVSLDIEKGGSGINNIHLKIGKTKYFYNGRSFLDKSGNQIPHSLRGNSSIQRSLQKALDFIKRGW